MMDAYEQQRENDVNGLLWVHRFGGLRAVELGGLMWPTNRTARQQADRLLRSWLSRKLVLKRMLPERAGALHVLASGGVRLLAQHGILAGSGKDIGAVTEKTWTPPLTWRHDLIGAGLLVELHRRGCQVFPETHLRRHAAELAKVPDCVAAHPDGKQVFWIEVENARKSGPEMRHLAQALVRVALGNAPAILGLKPTTGMVAFVPTARSELGHQIDHQTRVRNAVAAASRSDIDLTWAACTLQGVAGVGAISFSRERIPSDRAAAILRALDAGGWKDVNGCQEAHYDGHLAQVWQEDEEYKFAWAYRIDEKPAELVDNITLAKRGCASMLAGLAGAA